MGTLARGTVVLTSTPEIEASVEASLVGFAGYLNMTDEERDHLFNIHDETPFEKLVSIGSFYEEGDAVANTDGTITHTLVLSEKWYSNTQLVLRHFASLGMGVAAEFRAYDGNPWAYKAELGSHELECDELVPVASSRLATLEAKEAQLNASLESERVTLAALKDIQAIIDGRGGIFAEISEHLTRAIDSSLSQNKMASQ
jgi:hypothetical protein